VRAMLEGGDIALTGRRLGEFVLREHIGEGGFGMVYRADQPILEREAVVKVSQLRGRGEDGTVQRFLGEARLASRLDHPFAAHVYAFGAEPDGLLWIAMELVRGTPLDVMLAQGPLPLERAIPFLRRLCEVVHTAHEQGIVHRDLKPANVMVVARAGNVFPKLLDLGIATDLRTGAAGGAAVAGVLGGPAVAKTAHQVGTPYYMAPEQWVNASRAGPAADIYALGAVTYEVLTGAPPFTGRSVLEIAVQHARKPPPALPDTFPPALSAAINRAMAKRADERFATALELGEALRETSGIALESVNLPQIDELTRDEIIVHAPQPIAEAVAALDAARAPAAARTALWRAAHVCTQYVALVAVACRARAGPGRYGESPAVVEMLSTLRASGLDSAGWWKLARELIRPFAGMPDAYPIPELVGVFFDGKAPLRTAIDALIESEAGAPGPQASAEAVRDFLAGAVPALAAALRALRVLDDYALVVPNEDAFEEWMGVRRPVRPELAMATRVGRPTQRMLDTVEAPTRRMRAVERPDTEPMPLGRRRASPDAVTAPMPVGEPAPGRPVTTPMPARPAPPPPADDATSPLLVDPAGRPVVSLAVVAEAAPPSPGAPLELFWLDGPGRQGARMVALPSRLEHHRLDAWARLGLDATDAGSAAVRDDVPPYRGLMTFTESDADLFFGREREVEGFVNRLRSMALIAVVGPSGAGKSSFVRAGVLPTLGPTWSALVVRPGTTPLANLCARLATIDVTITPAEILADIDALGGRLRARSRALGTSLLLVVDQFEELFTLCFDAAEQDAYAGALVRAARTADETVRVVITLRDDFLVRAAQLAALRERLAASLQILTTPVADDLMRILIEPARRAGFEFEDAELPREMVSEVENQPAALALLSFTAAQLWQFRDRQFRQLPRNAYRALGGVGGALAKHAEDTLDAMTDDERKIVREAFRHLVTADGTRAVLSRAELLQVAGGAAAEPVIERLINARLLVAMESASGGGESIEVVHEALLSAWPRLVRWRHDDAEGARLRDQLRVAARQWADRGRPRGLLWRGEALTEYRLWRARYPGALTEVEEAFGQASLADAARGRRLRRIALGTVLVGLTVALVIFAQLRGAAEVSRARAEKSEVEVAKRLTESYVEQGRRALVDGDTADALLYLDQALHRGADGPALRFMLARALEPLDAEISTLRGHTGQLWSVDISPDGKQILTAAADGSVRLWAADTGAPLRTIAAHPEGELDAAWTPAGLVVSAGSDGMVKLWDPATGAARGVLDGKLGPLTGVSVDPTGSRITADTLSGAVRVWNLPEVGDGVVVGEPRPETSARAAFSPSGDRIALAFTDGATLGGGAEVWTIDGKRRVALEGHRQGVWYAVFDPAGTRVATASLDNTARIWNATTGKAIHVLRGHDARVTDVTWSRDGALVATGSADNTIKIWDAATGETVHGLRGHTAQVNRLVFTADGLLISAAADGTARVWDPRRGSLLATFAHGGFVFAVDVDGDVLATASWAATAKLWRLGRRSVRTIGGQPTFAPPAFTADGTGLIRNGEHAGEVWSLRNGTLRELPVAAGIVARSADAAGTRLAFADKAGTLHLFDAAGTALRSWPTGHAELAALSVAPDGAAVVTAGVDGAVVVWNAADGSARTRGTIAGIGGLEWSPDGTLLIATAFTPEGEARGVLLDPTLAERAVFDDLLGFFFSPDGSRIVTLQPGAVAKIRGTDGREQASLTFATEPTNLAWSPAGDRLYVGETDGIVEVWAGTGSEWRLATKITAHDNNIPSVTVSSDGNFLITVGADATLKIWDTATWRQIYGIAVAPGTVWAAIDPTGHWLVATDDTQVDVWSAAPATITAPALAEVIRCRLPVRLDGQAVVTAIAPDDCL
jgi:WD40 repeat protein